MPRAFGEGTAGPRVVGVQQGGIAAPSRPSPPGSRRRLGSGASKRQPQIPQDKAIRFFALGDWGNPSRRLKRVAKAMWVVRHSLLIPSLDRGAFL